MARGIWSGTINFGLVAIPVSVLPAIRRQKVAMHLLHDKDYKRLRREMYCPKDDAIVDSDDIVRGYEIEPEKFIVIEDDEIESIAPERSSSIEIMQFVDLEEIEPLYYDRPYYLAPNKGGEKPYALLVEALAKTKKAGIAKFVMRAQEYLIALRNIEGVLCIVTLHYQNERRSAEDIQPKDGKPKQKDIKRIQGLIKKMSKKFKPENYTDENTMRLLEVIKKKTKKSGTVEAPGYIEEEEETEKELLQTLEEEMEKVQG